MKIKNIFFFVIFFQSGYAFSANDLFLNKCLFASNQMNQALPKKIDYLTTSNRTFCTERNGKVFLVYDQKISTSKEKANIDFKLARKLMIRQYCGDGNYKNALNMFGFIFQYKDSLDNLIGDISIESSDC
jgi:hypothetical protein